MGTVDSVPSFAFCSLKVAYRDLRTQAHSILFRINNLRDSFHLVMEVSLAAEASAAVSLILRDSGARLEARRLGIMETEVCDTDVLEFLVFDCVDTPVRGDVDVARFHAAAGKVRIILKEMEFSV